MLHAKLATAPDPAPTALLLPVEELFAIQGGLIIHGVVGPPMSQITLIGVVTGGLANSPPHFPQLRA
jgi:hypothetical protein